MLKIIKKYQYAPREVLIAGEDYQISTKANKTICKRSTCKTEEQNNMVNDV